MALGFSQAVQVDILEWLGNISDMTARTTRWVSLHTATPESGNEISGNGYARKQVTFGTPTSATPSVMTNNADITFPLATGSSWSAVTHWGLYDQEASGGNLLFSGTLNTSFTAVVGSQIVISSGSLSISLD